LKNVPSRKDTEGDRRRESTGRAIARRRSAEGADEQPMMANNGGRCRRRPHRNRQTQDQHHNQPIEPESHGDDEERERERETKLVRTGTEATEEKQLSWKQHFNESILTASTQAKRSNETQLTCRMNHTSPTLNIRNKNERNLAGGC